ncbi:MAG: hypothetical protein RML12_03785 [Xanthomonadales bacterium]|nr:hypothetical protein [Xanthomonadales bacterium]
MWPESQRLAAPGWVTIEQPGSILRGRGLEADLSADRFQLLAETHATFRSPAR